MLHYCPLNDSTALITCFLPLSSVHASSMCVLGVSLPAFTLAGVCGDLHLCHGMTVLALHLALPRDGDVMTALVPGDALALTFSRVCIGTVGLCTRGLMQ